MSLIVIMIEWSIVRLACIESLNLASKLPGTLEDYSMLAKQIRWLIQLMGFIYYRYCKRSGPS